MPSLADPGFYLDPEWEALTQSMQDIFQRQYYTETGPMVRELEKAYRSFSHCEHTIAITNEWVALVMLLDTLTSKGEIIVPALAPQWVFQALQWHPELTVRLADWDPNTLSVSIPCIQRLINTNTCAIVVDHPFGCAVPIDQLRQARPTNAPTLISIGSTLVTTPDFTDLSGLAMCDAHIFSLHHRHFINGIEAAVIGTKHEMMADRLRVMRSSSGVVRSVAVHRTVNGRLSEAHAAIAVSSLEQAPARIDQIKQLKIQYLNHFKSFQGVELWDATLNDHTPYLVGTCDHDHPIHQVFSHGLSLADQADAASTPNAIELTARLFSIPFTFQGSVQWHPQCPTDLHFKG